jgi:hypothetical protein
MKRRQQITKQYRRPATRLHGDTSQKTVSLKICENIAYDMQNKGHAIRLHLEQNRTPKRFTGTRHVASLRKFLQAREVRS